MQKLLFTVAAVCRLKWSRHTFLFCWVLAALVAPQPAAWLGLSSCWASEPPLNLQIQIKNQNLVLLGPAWATNAQVEWSSNLAAGSWTISGQAFDPINGLILNNYSDAHRFFRLRLPAEGPRLLTQPANASRAVGESVTLSVTAAGTAPLSYQWLFNGTNFIADGVTASLTLTNLQLTTAGQYSVLVTNAYGATNSQPAALTVTSGNAPPGMVLVPAGAFDMGDTFTEGLDDERPVHNVYVSAFYLDKNLAGKTLWEAVYTWAGTNGYTFDNAGLAKGALYPVQNINWYDAVKWCNARSEMEGLTPVYYTSAAHDQVYKTGQVDLQEGFVLWTANGYRLPTEAEWEKAARGGVNGQRFPWGNTVTHDNANYLSEVDYAYDLSPTRGTHPLYSVGAEPYTSPVGSFAANGLGLFDMAGNVYEWCWDWAAYGWYDHTNAVLPDCRGPATGTARAIRGGGWDYKADRLRCARRGNDLPSAANVWESFGLRCARGL